MFGNNLDVLPQGSTGGSGGWMGAGPGGVGVSGGGAETTAVELVLDAVILEDGACIGPDETRFCESVTDELELERNTARQIVETLRGGASVGQVFEIVRPLARQRPPAGGQVEPRAFPLAAARDICEHGHSAIHQLVDGPGAEMLARKTADLRIENYGTGVYLLSREAQNDGNPG